MVHRMVLERISVDKWLPPWIRYQHITRYQHVASLVKGLRVVDAACGSGYGAYLMIGAGAISVDAFDIDDGSLQTARERYSHPHLSFKHANVCALPLDDQSCDLFVSLETIEHLDEDEGLLKEAARVLKGEGCFICSTPNRDVTNAGTSISAKPFNPFHVREYSQGEFEQLLHKYFSRVVIQGQTMFSKSYVRTLAAVGRIHPSLAVKIHQSRKLLTCAWDREENHAPREMKEGDVPEIMVAYCWR